MERDEQAYALMKTVLIDVAPWEAQRIDEIFPKKGTGRSIGQGPLGDGSSADNIALAILIYKFMEVFLEAYGKELGTRAGKVTPEMVKRLWDQLRKIVAERFLKRTDSMIFKVIKKKVPFLSRDNNEGTKHTDTAQTPELSQIFEDILVKHGVTDAEAKEVAEKVLKAMQAVVNSRQKQ